MNEKIKERKNERQKDKTNRTRQEKKKKLKRRKPEHGKNEAVNNMRKNNSIIQKRLTMAFRPKIFHERATNEVVT